MVWAAGKIARMDNSRDGSATSRNREPVGELARAWSCATHLGHELSCPDAKLSAKMILAWPTCANPRLRTKRRHVLERPTHRSTTKLRVRCLRRAWEELIKSKELFARYACTIWFAMLFGGVQCNSKLRLIYLRVGRTGSFKGDEPYRRACFSKTPFACRSVLSSQSSAAGPIIAERYGCNSIYAASERYCGVVAGG